MATPNGFHHVSLPTTSKSKANRDTALDMRDHLSAQGIACALGAGLAWGIVFVVPLVLADYPPAILSFGRYLAFGVIAIALALRDLPRLKALDRRDWLMAL